jgi:hypothetical protein
LPCRIGQRLPSVERAAGILPEDILTGTGIEDIHGKREWLVGCRCPQVDHFGPDRIARHAILGDKFSVSGQRYRFICGVEPDVSVYTEVAFR